LRCVAIHAVIAVCASLYTVDYIALFTSLIGPGPGPASGGVALAATKWLAVDVATNFRLLPDSWLLALTISCGYWIHDFVFGFWFLRDGTGSAAAAPVSTENGTPAVQRVTIRARDVLLHHVVCFVAAVFVLAPPLSGTIASTTLSPAPLLALLLTEAPNIASHTEWIVKTISDSRRARASGDVVAASDNQLKRVVSVLHALKYAGYIVFRVIFVNIILYQLNVVIFTKFPHPLKQWTSSLAVLMGLSWIFILLGLYWIAIIACKSKTMSASASAVAPAKTKTN
jgi:hypothetical protein